MKDRLAEILKIYNIKARVFHSGNLCGTANFDEDSGLGYIHVLRQGKLKITSPSHSEQIVDEPCLIVYMNPIAHLLHAPIDNAELVCASFECGINTGNPLSLALPEMILIKLKDMESLNHTLSALFNESMTNNCGKQDILDRLIEVVIIQSLRFLMTTKALESGLLAGLADLQLNKSITAIHASPGEPWSLDAMASIAGMSRSRFAAKFLRVVGVTPGNYLSDWRFGIAKSLLAEGKSIQFAADKVGYNSASALSRAFRKRYGFSPTKWIQGVH